MAKKNGHNPTSVRVNNRKNVLGIIRKSEDITVARITKEIQLSKTTLWKVMDHFIKHNLVINSGKDMVSEELGKKSELYRFNVFYAYVITITIYEKTILLALADAKAHIFYKETVYLNNNEKLNKIISIIASFIEKWQNPENLPEDRKNSKLIGIAIASSGVIDFQRGICFTASRFHSWPIEAPIKEMILDKVEINVPFYIDNYNRFFGFAEMTLGKHDSKKNIVDIVITNGGLGAGIIADSKIKRGPKFLAGEIGHICLDPNYMEACHCGGYGCFEQLVSSNRIIEKAINGKRLYSESIIYNDELTLQNIFNATNKSDKWATTLLDDVIKWFAIGIQNIILVFNPEIVIISGEYRTAGDYFKNRLVEMINNTSLLRMNKDIQIEYSEFDEEGALIGATSYVLFDYFNNRFEY